MTFEELKRKANEPGFPGEAYQDALNTLDKEHRRLQAYSIAGRVAPDIQALNSLRCQICNTKLKTEIISLWPDIVGAYKNSWVASRAVELVAKPVENMSIPVPGVGTVDGKPVAHAMRVAAKVIGAAYSFVKNKNGAHDHLKGTCGAMVETVKSYSTSIVDFGKEMVQNPVGTASGIVKGGARLLGRAVEATHDCVRTILNKTGDVAQAVVTKVKGWANKFVSLFR